MTKPNGETTSFEYDSAGNRTRLAYSGNPSGGSGATSWEYDALSRVTEETVVGVAASRTWSYQGLDTFYLDRNGVVHQKSVSPTTGIVTTTASSGGLAYEREEAYASSGDLIRLDESLEEGIDSVYASHFIYDGDLSDQNSTNSYGFNFRGDHLDHTTSTDFDTRGQIDQRTFSFQGSENAATDLWTDGFDFDWLGRQTAVERTIEDLSGDIASIWNNADEPENKRVRYGYNVDGSRTGIDRYDLSTSTSNPVATTELTYTPGGRTQEILHLTDTGTSFLAKHAYGYDAVGRLVAQADHFTDGAGSDYRLNSRTFSYDNAGQLTSVTETIDAGTAQVRSYTDGQSSTSDDWTVGNDNRLSQDDNYDYEYNAEGQLTKRTSRLSPSLGANDIFRWDPTGRLISVTQRDTSDTVLQTIEYGYDANGLQSGRRVVAADGTTVTSKTGFIRDGLQVLAKLDLSSTDPVLTELYLHGTQPNEIVATDVLGSSGYNTVWAFTDALGSLTTVATANISDWDVVHSVTSEYGGNRQQLGDTSVPHLTSSSIWAGHHLDEDTGLIEAKARWYDASSGRFISEDPVGFAAGDANLYRYVGNSPANATDPNGLEKFSIIAIGRKAVESFSEASSHLPGPMRTIGQRAIANFSNGIDSYEDWVNQYNSAATPFSYDQVASGMPSLMMRPLPPDTDIRRATLREFDEIFVERGVESVNTAAGCDPRSAPWDGRKLVFVKRGLLGQTVGSHADSWKRKPHGCSS